MKPKREKKKKKLAEAKSATMPKIGIVLCKGIRESMSSFLSRDPSTDTSLLDQVDC